MKKKTILSSSVFVASLLTASAVFAGGPEVIVIPDYFSGFYIGGTVAGHHASLHENSTLTLTEPLVLFYYSGRASRTDREILDSDDLYCPRNNTKYIQPRAVLGMHSEVLSVVWVKYGIIDGI